MNRVVRLVVGVLSLAALCAVTVGGEIKISGPDSKVRAGRVVTLKIDGISLPDLPRAVVDVSPSDGVLSILPQVSWGGQPLIAIQAEPETETVYVVTVTVNHWRRDLDAAVAKATQGQIDPSLLSELRAVQAKIETAYPFASGAGQVTYLGTGPAPAPDPPKPPVPPQPVAGKRKVVVLHETAEDTYEMSSLIVELQSGESAAAKHIDAKGHTVSFLDDDLEQARVLMAAVNAQGKSIGSERPAMVIMDDKGAVLWAGKMESVSAAWFLDQLKKYGG